MVVFPDLIPFSLSNSFYKHLHFCMKLYPAWYTYSDFCFRDCLLPDSALTSQELTENRPLKMGRMVGYLFRLGLELVMTFLSIETGIQIMQGLCWQMVFKFIIWSCLELKYYGGQSFGRLNGHCYRMLWWKHRVWGLLGCGWVGYFWLHWKERNK